MSKLNVDQKTIKDLFQAKQSDFLIPDYQRPYAWGESECQTLWDDIFSFAIPDDGRTEFDSNSEYFLGPIVTFKNTDNGKMEVRSLGICRTRHPFPRNKTSKSVSGKRMNLVSLICSN